MLGAALGTFAASYADTVELSLAERIEYENGVEVRVSLGESGYSTAQGVRSRLGPVEGVEAVAATHRAKVSAGRSIGTTSSVTILGVEPRAAVDMMWFREDLSLLPFEDSDRGDRRAAGRARREHSFRDADAARLGADGRGRDRPDALGADPRRRRPLLHRRRNRVARRRHRLDSQSTSTSSKRSLRSARPSRTRCTRW